MPRIKVLLLEKHITLKEIKREIPYLEEIIPVFKRRGKYLLGELCWFEVGGRAFKFNRLQFLHDLETWHASEMDQRKVSALQAVVDNRMATKRQEQLLRQYKHSRDLHEIRMGVYRFERKRSRSENP